MENWLPVVGFEGSYEVSDRGQVRSLDRVVERPNNVPMRWKGRLLRPGTMRGGHLMVCLCGKAKAVHQLVAAAFLGPRPERMEVRHLNGDETDNRVENLAYGTRGENLRDRKYHAGQRGRLTINQIREIKNHLALGRIQREIAEEFSVHLNTVHRISTGRIHDNV